MTQQQKKQAEAYLDERYEYTTTERNENGANTIFYRGCVAMLERLGYDWERLKNGKHKIY